MEHLADMRMEPLITRTTSPPSRDPESRSEFGVHFGSERPLTPGGPSTSFAQPLSVDDDLSDLFSETDQPVASDALKTTQQESPTFESVVDEILRQPLSVDDLSDPSSVADPFPEIGESMTAGVFEATQQEQQSCFGMSAYDLFHVSFESEPDLGILSEIHARASAPNHLACCIMHRLEDFDSHLEVGRFPYG